MFSKTDRSHQHILVMEAVIIFDAFDFAASAVSTLVRVGRQAGVNVRWTTTCWPINTLKNLAFAEQALVHASDSHIIVFPAKRASRLPPWIRDWLRRWARGRTVQNAALGIIADGTAAEAAKLPFSELRRFAREHGLSLIVDGGQPTKNPTRLFVDFKPQSQVALPALQTHLTVDTTRGSYRSFGINE